MGNGQAKAYDVFLSHAHVDADIVETLAKTLKTSGLRVWLDKWELVPGEDWQDGMATGIATSASCAVCVQSKTPVGWFKQEVHTALNRKTKDPTLRVIPVVLPGGDSSFVDDFLSLLTWVQFKDGIDDADALHRLVCGIRGIAPGSGPDSPPAKPNSIFMVPLPENPFFTERGTELSDLKAALEKTGSYALTGLGGVGKTQTAAEYAHRHRGEYEAVVWLRAQKEDTLFADLTALAGLLKLPEAKAQEQQVAVDAALFWLDEQDDWLVVLDNVTDLKIVADLTRKARPQRHHVIVTQQALTTGAILSKKKLASMADETGALLLLRRAGLIEADGSLSQAQGTDADAAKAISAKLGGLPLALDQAGAYISEKQCGMTDYLELVSGNLAELLKERGDLDFQHVSVMATYSTSLTELAKLNEAAAELLKAAAFLAPDAIPEEIFTEGASEFPEALQQATANRLQWNDAVAAAFKFSLLERNPSDKTIAVHRMVQAVARSGMKPEEREQWAERVVGAVNAALPAPEFANWGTYERLLPHAQVCAALIDEYGLSSPGASMLLNQAGSYLRQRARNAEAEPLYRRSLDIAEKVFGSENPEVAIRLNNLAQLLKATNRMGEAEPLMKRALAIDEKAYGPDHPNVAIRLNNLAQLLQATNRLREAEPLYRRALAMDEKSYGPDHPDVAIDLNNLAQLLQDTKRLGEAEPLMKRVVEIFEKSYGSEHPNVATALNNLAQLLQDTKRLGEAEPLMKRALAIDEKAYGPDHPDVAIRLNNLAGLLRATSRLGEAEPLMKRALAIDEKSYGPDHPDVARDLNNLAQLLQDTNRPGEAEPLMRRGVVIFVRSLGPEHPSTVTVRNNYVGLLQQMGYTEEQVRARLREITSE